MTISHFNHRRAAIHRRAPQGGFDPSTMFGFGGGRGGGFGSGDGDGDDSPTGIATDLSPPVLPTNDDLPRFTTIFPSSQTTGTSSGSSSASTSDSSPTSTPTPTPTPTSTVTPPPPQPTTSKVNTNTNTAVIRTTTTPTSSPTPSNSGIADGSNAPQESTGLSTGVVVGGIAAGIVAIAVIGFVIAFFMRRARRRETRAFDAGDFRRSAMVLNNDSTRDDNIGRGFNPPRPPSMIENRHASPAPTFGTQYGSPGPVHEQYGYGAGPYQSFTPGQVINGHNGVHSPLSATSAHPMFPPNAYAQSPFSPIGSPASEQGHYPGRYEDVGQQSAGMAAYPVLTRQGSLERSQEMMRESAPTGDYVDLSRSSVSPFQAAQYAEISKRLNTEVPEGLQTADFDREMPPALPPKSGDMVSPFEDPASAPPSPGAQFAAVRRQSGESVASQSLEFPVPPIPAAMSASRYRIDSMPPMLPEIHVESRVSVGNYPGLNNEHIAVGALTPGGSRFPTTPSPLASTFSMPPTPPSAHGSFAAVATAMPPPAATSSTAVPSIADAPKTHAPKTSMEKKRKSTYSMYDPEDAYGGF